MGKRTTIQGTYYNGNGKTENPIKIRREKSGKHE